MSAPLLLLAVLGAYLADTVILPPLLGGAARPSLLVGVLTYAALNRRGVWGTIIGRLAGVPVVIAHGTLETPEFQRQNREFAAAVKAAGKPVTFLLGQGYNHFEMFETLGNPYGLVGRAMLQLMNLKTPAVA